MASQSNNIIIGNAGTAGQNQSIVIGDSANQTAAYIAGIYGETTGAYLPVGIDSNNTLGTSSADLPTNIGTYPFLAYQVGQTPFILGNNTPYYLGSYIALTKAFDIGTNFYVGAGGGSVGQSNGAYYLAPAAGRYQFMMNIYVSTQPSPSTVVFYNNFISQIQTTTNIYEYTESVPGGPTTGAFPRQSTNFWFTFQATITLAQGDKVWFNTNTTVYGTPALDAKVGDTGYLPARSTRISGFRVA